jgi:GNAT superfamily N-acetyltransferase
MTIAIREARPDEIEELIPVLRQAEESISALRWSLANLSDTVYRMDDDGQLVGAVTMQWRNDPCEIMELAIAPERQRQGLGRQLVAWLIDEARRRGKRKLIVGTANSSIGNIIFYQRCGLRMDQVRRDYFWYYRKPHFENGIQIRDMLVFRFDLADGSEDRG